MSAAENKAVFLSYASQDAEAAKRIADALRVAGVEVWFDQSELVGGDQWDQKIRKQIAECALFVPVISANTQARLEGYFRIEWKLAARRTHAMASAKAFLLPIVIDDTHDASAHVPDEFRDVQWTRLKGGETPASFCERVKKLLSDDVGRDLRIPPASGKARFGEPALQVKSPRWLAPVIAGGVIAVLALIFTRPWEKAKPTLTADATKAGVSTTEIPEVAQLRARLRPDRWQAGDFEAMAPTLDRLTQANSDDVEAWALLSIINSLQVARNLDSGTRPLEQGKAAAERALRLSPNSPLAELAFGLHLTAMISRGGDVRASRSHLERGVAGLPRDALTRYAELAGFWLGYQVNDAQRSARAWLADEPHASLPAWILAESLLATRQTAEAEKWAEDAAANNEITGVRARVTLFEASYYLRADLTAARAALDRIPAGRQGVHRVVYARWLVAMAERRWDQALQELARVPEPILFDRNFHGPKSLLAGMAHRAANRPEAARTQFQEAERLLREALAHDPENEELHAVLALTLAYEGRATEAQGELAAVEPLLTGREPSHYVAHETALVAQTYGLLGDMVKMTQSLRWLFTNPSVLPMTPASVRLDPRFSAYVSEPPVAALLAEFASLDQPATVKTEDRGQKTEISAPIDLKSVAVLAFANLSDDKANEYFSDGISEELLNVLAKIPGLKVAARTSAFYFKGKEVPVPEIAKQLGVAYVVEGSVRKQGDKVRITAQLIKAADGFHVWSDTFTRDLKDIFAVQDEIAGLIAKNLELKMGMVAARPTIDLEAYQEYLAGRAAVEAGTTTSVRAGIGHFRTAVRLEPKLTAAWVQIARTYVHLSRWGGLLNKDEWLETQRAMDRAIALEPASPDVWLALGWVRRTADWNWLGAEKALRESLRLRPNHAESLAALGVLLANLGREEEALELARRATELDPFNAATQMDLLSIFYSYGRFAEALEAGRRAVQLAPGAQVIRSWLALSLVGLRRFPEAEAEAALEPESFARQGAQIMIVAKQDRMAEARALVRDYEVKAKAAGGAWNSYAFLAFLSGHVGQVAAGVDALEIARKIHDPSIAWSRTSFYSGVLGTDPRWPDFLHSVGLADDQLK